MNGQFQANRLIGWFMLDHPHRWPGTILNLMEWYDHEAVADFSQWSLSQGHITLSTFYQQKRKLDEDKRRREDGDTE